MRLLREACKTMVLNLKGEPIKPLSCTSPGVQVDADLELVFARRALLTTSRQTGLGLLKGAVIGIPCSCDLFVSLETGRTGQGWPGRLPNVGSSMTRS